MRFAFVGLGELVFLLKNSHTVLLKRGGPKAAREG